MKLRKTVAVSLEYSSFWPLQRRRIWGIHSLLNVTPPPFRVDIFELRTHTSKRRWPGMFDKWPFRAAILLVSVREVNSLASSCLHRNMSRRQSAASVQRNVSMSACSALSVRYVSRSDECSCASRMKEIRATIFCLRRFERNREDHNMKLLCQENLKSVNHLVHKGHTVS
jgi:hypothetical protein